MAVETVVKQKGTKTCKDCDSNLAMSATKCQNCNSTNISKLRVVIRKTESTGEDAVAPDSADEENEETEEDDELTEDDFEPADEEDEEDEDEEDEETDEDEEEDPKVTKRIVRRRTRVAKSSAPDVNLDIFLAALTVAEDISKAVASGDIEGDDSAFEEAMVAFNNVVDAGVSEWVNGGSISKESPDDKLARLRDKLKALKAKADPDGDGDDDTTAEGDTDHDVFDKNGKKIQKSAEEDIFKGLTPAAAAVLRKAQEIQERDETRQFEDVAKSFGELPVSDEELGAALRHISKTDNKHYETVTKALKAAAEAQEQSAIFKSFGSSQGGSTGQNSDGEITAIVKSIRDENKGLTEEQAYAEAMHRDPGLYERMLSGSMK